jgi:ferric-dicitrate binding protein FerR (iron transport regulator)
MNCEQFDQYAADFLEGELDAARTEALMAHVEACEACRAELQAYVGQDRELEGYFARQRERLATLPSPLPDLEAAAPTTPARRSWPAWARMAATIVAVACMGGLWQAWRLNVPQGVAPVARLAAAQGPVLTLAKGQARLLAVGDPILQGARLKVAQGGYAALELPGKGNLLELKGGTQATLADFADRTEVQLNLGEAWAHLPTHPARPFVIRTADLTATAHGTVYDVEQELGRSIVRVAEGTVDVVAKGVESAVGSGQSYSTLATATTPSSDEAIAWSRHQEDLTALASAGGDAGTTGRALASAMSDANAQTSDAATTATAKTAASDATTSATTAPAIADVTRVLPERTRFYVILNDLPKLLGEFHKSDFSSLLGRAELLRWWSSVKGQNVMDELKNQLSLLALLNIVQQLDGQLAVAVAAVDRVKPTDPASALLIVADCKTGAEGLRQAIENWVASNSSGSNNAQALDQQRQEMEKHMQAAGGRLVICSDEALLASTVQALESGAPTGFQATDFQKKIAANVAAGTPLAVAVDLADVLDPRTLFGDRTTSATESQANARATYDFLGLESLDYALVAPDIVGHGANQAARLGFKQSRAGAMDWLAEPSPMRGLLFFSPEARLIGDAVLKNPGAVYYDWDLNFNKARKDSLPGQMLRLLGENKALLDAMGGEVAVGLENPILPIPNVKVVVELRDPAAFQAQFGKLVDRLVAQVNQSAPIPVTLITTQSGERTIDSIGAAGSPIDLSWTFVDDFLVLGPGPRFVENSIQVYDSGRSIAGDSKLLGLMPTGAGSTFSMLTYQNLAAAMPDVLKSALIGGGKAIAAASDDSASSTTRSSFVSNLAFLSSMDAPGIAYAYAGDGSIDFYVNAPSGLAQNMGMAIPVMANWLSDKLGDSLSGRLAKVAKARAGLAKVAAAAEVYKQDKGRWPASLGDLIKSSDPYIKSIPLDPFGLAQGDTLRLLAGPGADQVTFYSIGPDGVDDRAATLYNPNVDWNGKGDIAVTLPLRDDAATTATTSTDDGGATAATTTGAAATSQ